MEYEAKIDVKNKVIKVFGSIEIAIIYMQETADS
jgi:hypothetical protein